MRETEVEDANESQEEQQEWQGQAKEEHEDDEDGAEEEESVLVQEQEQEREQEREREEHDKDEQDENDESKESEAESEAEATDVENEEAQDEADTELSSLPSVASATSRKTNRDEAEEGEEEGNEEPSCLSEAQCCLTENLDVDLEKDKDEKLKGDKDKKPQLPQLPASPTKLFTSEKSIPQASSYSKSLADDKTAKTFTRQTEGKILHKMSKSEGQNINTAQSRDADTLYKGEFLTIHQGTMEHHEEHATYIQAPPDATDTTTTAHKQQQQQPQHTSMTVQTLLTQGPVIIRPTEPLQASSTSRMPQVPPSTPPIETQVQPGAVSVPGIRHGHSYQRTSLASVQSHRPSSTMSSSPSFRSMVPLTATAADFHIHIPDEDHDANAHDEVEACQRNQNGERLLHNAAVLVQATPVSLDEQRRMQQQQQQDHDSDTHQDTSSNPLDKNPHETNHTTTRKQRILLSCVLIVLLTVLLPIMIASFMKPKTTTPPMDMSSPSSSTILLQQQQQQEAFKKAAIRSPSCPHPTTQNNTCITTMQQFNQAVLDPNTTTVVLCHGTVLDVHSRNGRGMVIRKDDFTLCCAPPPPPPPQDTAIMEQDTRIAKSSAWGNNCTIQSHSQSLTLNLLGRNTHLLGIHFHIAKPSSAEGGARGNVAIQGAGRHVLMDCKFQNGIAHGFDAVGGNLRIDGTPFGSDVLSRGVGSMVEVWNCTFLGGIARSFGGGACLQNLDFVNITQCTFQKNEAKSGGGLAVHKASSIKLRHVVFHGNGARENLTLPKEVEESTPASLFFSIGGGGSGGEEVEGGGGMNIVMISRENDDAAGVTKGWNSSEGDVEEVDVQLEQCVFQDNEAVYGGGFLLSHHDEVQDQPARPLKVHVSNCTFQGNLAKKNGASGFLSSSSGGGEDMDVFDMSLVLNTGIDNVAAMSCPRILVNNTGSCLAWESVS